MADDFTFDSPTAAGQAMAPGRPVVVIGQTPPGDDNFTFDGPVPPTPPYESTGKDKALVARTKFIDAPLDLVGLPGNIDRMYEQGKKDIPLQNDPELKALSAEKDVGTPFAGGMSPEMFHQFVGRHAWTGDEIKDWFYKTTGMQRREPNPESTAEGVIGGAAGGLGTAIIPGMGGKAILSTIAGGAGSLAEKIFSDHPALANFATQVLTFLGGGAARKTLSETAPVIRETLGGSVNDRAGTALVRASGLPKSEVEARLAAPTEIVPGSEPTTSQVINTPSIAAAEKGVRVDPVAGNALVERSNQQAAAREASAGTVAPTGDVNAPGKFLNETKEGIEQNISTMEKAAADEIKVRLDALGPGATPDQAGAIIREVVGKHYADAKKAATTAEKTVIETQRAEKVAFDTAPAVNRIDRVLREKYGRMNPTPSDIKQMRDRIENAGEQMTWKDMQDTRQALSKLADDYARSPHDLDTVKSMRKIIDERIDASASSVLKIPEALRRFTSEGEAVTVRERLIRLNELRDLQGMPPMPAWKQSRDKLEARITDMEKGMRTDFGAAPNAMNPDEYQRYLHAKDLKAQTVDRYERGAIGDVRAGGSEMGGTDLTKSEVPGRFWNTRNTSREDIDQFTKVLGGSPEATAALRNYAVGELRAMVEANGGNLTQKQLDTYLVKHAAALDSPVGEPIKRELSNLATAREAMDAHVESGKKLLVDYQKSGASHFLNANGVVDPDVAISKALSPKNPTGRQDMVQLTQLARKGGPDVEEGLRALVRDDFVKSSGGFKDADKAAAWLNNNREKLTPLLGKDHMDTLEAIAKDMSRGVHPTPGNPLSLARMLNDAKAGNFGFLDSLGRIPGAGAVTGFIKSKLTGSAHDAELVSDIFNQAMLDPKAAKILMSNVTRNTDAGAAAFLENSWNAIKNRTAHDSGTWKSIKGPVKAGSAISLERATEEDDDGK